MNGDVHEAKQRLPLPALMNQLGLSLHARKSARCPFHEDKRNSFSVWRSECGWFFKCHAGCGEGDEINLLELHKQLSRADATKLFLKMAGVNGIAQSTRKPDENKTLISFDWLACVQAFNKTHLERLADSRGLSGAFCSWLHQRALIGLYDGCIAFPIDDNGKVVGAHYRLKDGSWRVHPDGTRMRPLIIGDISKATIVHASESQWDAFDVCDKLSLHEQEGVAVIVTRGAGNGALVSGLISPKATVFAWKQNDQLKNGKRAGDEWLKAVATQAGAPVQVVTVPPQFKDANEWTKEGNATADELESALDRAEVVPPTKKANAGEQADCSWTDALNRSVITSRELHDLTLIPRKKLLGDWFCEGDLGFIFAFRGVGKTWLALAIAQSLSTGGKLGDWQAGGPVKVLYLDGEMPPDLMRGRCEGLQASNGNLYLLNHEILFERAGRVMNIANPEVQQAITAHCVASGVNVLILDNLSTLASGVRENEADSWEQVNYWLLDLRRRKIAVVIVHHAGRSGEMRGTSKREDNVFWIIRIG